MHTMGAKSWVVINVMVVLLISCSAAESTSEESPALEMLFGVMDKVDSSVVRGAGNKFIEIQAAILRFKWNLAVDLWDELTPEQREGLVRSVMEGLEGARQRIEAAASGAPPLN